jgi:hypothetical protein
MRVMAGITVALFISVSAAAQVPNDLDQTTASFALGAGKLLQLGHEGRVTEQQILAKFTAPILQYDRNGDGLDRADAPAGQSYEISEFLRAISLLDPAYKDRFTLDNAGVLAHWLLFRLDTNQDDLVGAYEIIDLIAARQPPAEGTCKVPAVPDGAEVLLIGANEGAQFASVNLGDISEVTYYSDIFVEDGNRPLYVLLSAYNSIVWNFRGNTARIKQIAIAGYHAQGVVGIDPTKVAFITGTNCLTPAYQSDDGLTSQFDAQRLVGTGVKVAGDYDLYAMWIPSMGVQPKGQALPPDSVVAVDPTRVVAEAKVSALEVLPQRAGIQQLLASGQLEQVDAGTYRIVKPIAQYPAGLAGANSVRFILAPGVPEPAGNAGHSCFLPNEDGPCLGYDTRP